MKISLASVAALGLMAQTAAAHYVYSILQINGQDTRDWQYIRQNNNNIQPTKEFLRPSDDFRCNSGSFANAGRTEVARVSPGTRLGFKLWNRGTIIHPGPMTIHMSRAPGDVRQYRGDGQWFKVYEDTICGPMNPLRDSDWCSWEKPNVEFTVPEGTPPGQYLVRVEHIALHGAQSGDTEFYFTCAQVEVTGNGNGNPGPLVRIPGLYDSNDPALRFFIYGAREYPYRQVGAHTVWRGGNSGGSPPSSPPPSSPPPSGGGGGAGMWEQCGGNGWTGPTTCREGTCQVQNEWYHQCL